MATCFNISPKKRASILHYFYRQLFVRPPPVSRHDGDLSGKTAIVTGCSGGLGLETCRQLLDLGCSVILAVRDESKGHEVKQLLSEGRDLISTSIQVWKLDLSSYDSITAFAGRCSADLDQLDIAVLNAGVFKFVESFSATTGYEEGVQINFLANILLALLLLPIIKQKRQKSNSGHICLVSSDTAAWSRFDERSADPLLAAFKDRMPVWDSRDRYGTTKLLGQLFIAQVARRLEPSGVIMSCANPGFCAGSGLGRETTGLSRDAYKIHAYLLGRKCSVGARTIVHAVATLGESAHGQYVEDAKIQPMPPFLYTPEGLKLGHKLYEETLDELSFAGVGVL